MNEWPLLFFTILFQFSVGAFILLEYTRANALSDNSLPTDYFKKPYIIIGGTLILSLFFSVFHLGSPFRALYSIANIEDSWLSREILFVGLFAFLFFVCLTIVFVKNSRANKFLIILSGIFGLVAIFTMSKIYMLPTVPAWNNLHTPISFFSTAFLLGTLFALIVNLQTGILSINYKKVILLSSFFIIIALLNELYFAIMINTTEFNVYLIVLRLLLLISLLIISLRMGTIEKIDQSQLNTFYFFFFLAIISELLGRILFYNSYYSIGL